MINFSKNQKGYVVLMVTFFAMLIMLSLAVSMSFLVVNAKKNITNSIKSTQSYYAAEAGVEDALVRLKKNPALTTLTYQITVNGATTTVNIPSTVGASKNITSQADNGGMKKKVQVISSIDNGASTSFYYGVEVGAGGAFNEWWH